MNRDEVLLLDILIAARKPQRYIAEMNEMEFRGSDLHQSAVVRELQVIGEAARQVSKEFRDSHPELDWQSMAGMRNRLIHEYFRVSLEVVLQTIRDDIPNLIATLETLMPPSDEE